MIPGKVRCIGGAYPGAERYERLVTERYNLTTLRGMRAEEFLAEAEQWGSKATYDRWLAAYKANAGSFLDHVVWGADRDLGGRYLYGAMDDRYATNAHRVFVPGGLDAARHVAGKRAAVVGAWDGTECLLLHALGAISVDAVEEVGAFAKMAKLQLAAWGVPGESYGMSLYEVNVYRTWQKYDLLYVPGVLYHLTDLPTAMVILWSMLAPGGVLAFESIVDAPSSTTSARYLGASVPGWNWWSPSPSCYAAMLRDAGFPDGRMAEQSNGRGWWVGTKGDDLPALRTGAAGFSRPDLLREIRSKLTS